MYMSPLLPKELFGIPTPPSSDEPLTPLNPVRPIGPASPLAPCGPAAPFSPFAPATPRAPKLIKVLPLGHLRAAGKETTFVVLLTQKL
jgi:hypothetical protein